MRTFSILLTIALAISLLMLSACVPKPKAAGSSKIQPADPISSESAGTSGRQSSLGSFNIHKRHGLGAWEGQSGPSEQTLLQQMASPTSGKSNPNQSTSIRKETH